ncbi:MAG: DUF861 domain-containing protein [Planctomycetes bacterium]|nr:DUF861 domain-containing protein [Planctomycetota bacterium]
MIRSILRRAVGKYTRTVHARGSRFHHATAPARDGAWSEQPIKSADVLEGAPRARAVEFAHTGDGGLVCGSWDCTAGSFRWYYGCDEVITILEGEAFVTVDGERAHLRPGSVVFFPLDAEALWEVPNYVRKQFVLRYPAPLLRRMVE